MAHFPLHYLPDLCLRRPLHLHRAHGQRRLQDLPGVPHCDERPSARHAVQQQDSHQPQQLDRAPHLVFRPGCLLLSDDDSLL